MMKNFQSGFKNWVESSNFNLEEIISLKADPRFQKFMTLLENMKLDTILALTQRPDAKQKTRTDWQSEYLEVVASRASIETITDAMGILTQVEEWIRQEKRETENQSKEKDDENAK